MNPSSKKVVCVDLEGREYNITAEKLRWRPSAYGFVIKSGKLLVSKQFDGYDLPGGGIDLGETAEQAVIREIKEETGIDAANPRLLACNTGFVRLPIQEGVFIQSIMLYYQCDATGGELSKDGFDEQEKIYADMPEWIPLEKLGSIKPASTNDYRQYLNLIRQ